MSSAPIAVAETSEFRRTAERLLTKDEIDKLIEYVARHPMSGDLIEGTGGIRKMRWAVEGRGKRGGVRVIYFFHDFRFLVLLLSIFAKNVKADLSAQERNLLKRHVETLKRARSGK